ncbi:MAG: MlaD family protein [Verrucomicrobiota bacterium]|nr:MlaD family protein [Verrucomicrobiota bacterium]
MKDTLNAFRVGLFFVFGLALLYVTYTLLSNARFEQDKGYNVTATFSNIKTLGNNADVRMAGVKIGTVQATELVNGKGVVTLLIDNKYKVPADSVAYIGIAGLLGQNYIIVDFGTETVGALKAGDAIKTKNSADFNDIIAKVEALGDKMNHVVDSFTGGSGGKTTATDAAGTAIAGPGNLFTNLNSLVTENRGRIDSVLTNLDSIAAQLSKGEGTLGKLMYSDEAYNKLNATVDEIRKAAETANATLASANSIVADIKSGQGTLGALIYKDDTINEFNKVLKNLTEFSEKLNSNQGTLGKLVNDDTIYRELRSLMSNADRALGNMGDSGPMTAVGVAANAIF